MDRNVRLNYYEFMVSLTPYLLGPNGEISTEMWFTLTQEYYLVPIWIIWYAVVIKGLWNTKLLMVAETRAELSERAASFHALTTVLILPVILLQKLSYVPFSMFSSGATVIFINWCPSLDIFNFPESHR